MTAVSTRLRAAAIDRRGWLYCAGYGAVVTVVLSFLPLSSIAGGAVAAYRSGSGYFRGMGIGALAGVFAAIPLLVLFVPALAIAGALGFGVAPSAPAYDVFLVIIGILFLCYTVGGSAFGGLVGAWIRRNTDRSPDPVDWL